MAFSIFAFAGCENVFDINDLLSRIEELESQLAYLNTGGQNNEPGQNGTDGQDGLTPHIGGNGNWWIGQHDTHIPARGPAGVGGQDGTTPHIGGNGNWWIGEEDTGVQASTLPARYRFGLEDTFYYVTTTGLTLFSIEVLRHTTTALRIIIVNYNMPLTPTSAFLSVRHRNEFGNWSMHSAPDMLDYGGTVDWIVTVGDASYIWVGAPLPAGGAIRPFARFCIMPANP